jgi:hypothetical protein
VSQLEAARTVVRVEEQAADRVDGQVLVAVVVEIGHEGAARHVEETHSAVEAAITESPRVVAHQEAIGQAARLREVEVVAPVVVDIAESETVMSEAEDVEATLNPPLPFGDAPGQFALEGGLGGENRGGRVHHQGLGLECNRFQIAHGDGLRVERIAVGGAGPPKRDGCVDLLRLSSASGGDLP